MGRDAPGERWALRVPVLRVPVHVPVHVSLRVPLRAPLQVLLVPALLPAGFPLSGACFDRAATIRRYASLTRIIRRSHWPRS